MLAKFVLLLFMILLSLAACAPAPTAAPAAPAATEPPTLTTVPPTEAPTITPEPATETPEAATATSVSPTTTPAPVADPEPESEADPEPEPEADPEPAPGTGDPVRGQQAYSTLPCTGCHGPNAQGDLGPKIAGTELSFEDVHKQVREGEAPMPAFPPEQVSDQQIRDIYAWLQGLE